MFASHVGCSFSFEFGYDQAMRRFQPVDGMDQKLGVLARAMGEERIRTGACSRPDPSGA
ncbi:hypothetical protein ACWEKM_12740 [Streptomyces sp. NPDC004752]